MKLNYNKLNLSRNKTAGEISNNKNNFCDLIDKLKSAKDEITKSAKPLKILK